MVRISVLTEENVNPLNNGSNTTNSISTTHSISSSSSSSSSSSVSSNSSSSNRCSGVVDITKTSDSLKRKRPLKIQLPSSILREIQIEKIKTKDNMIVEDQQPLEYMDLGVGVFCKKGKKKFMEDTHKIVSGLNGNPKKGFYGVYDGHGGRKAAEFVAEHLHQNILNILEKSEGNMTKEEAVKAAYLKTDDEFLKQGLGSGTCCVTCLVEEKNIVVSNVGDCRAVLCRGGVAESLTIDHRVEQEGERRRIEKKGGYVEIHRGAWRVHGILSVSRSIGDAHLKDWVEAEPDTKTLDLTPEMNFIVLASDGLWDKVENQEVVDTALRVCLGPDKLQLTNDCWKEDDEFACENTSPPSKSRRISLVKQQKVKSHSPPQQIKHNRKRPISNRLVAACKELVNLAVTRGSLDDITVMIIDLHHLGCNN